MSIFNNNLLAGAAAQGGTTPVHTIDQSIRFNDDDSGRMGRTPGSASNRRTWTFSVWIKRGNLDSSGFKFIFSRAEASVAAYIGFYQDDFTYAAASGSVEINLITDRKFRDPSAWYHIVVVQDTTNVVASERVRIYVNGTRETSFSTETYPALNYQGYFNTTSLHDIGVSRPSGSISGYFDGYMAEIVFIDGQALDPSSFGEYNSSGIWIPKDVSGLTFGTNGFHIDGRDSADLGDDESGNGNDFSTSGLTSDDQKSDSPTNNHATWNSITGTAQAYSNGNLKASSSSNAWKGGFTTAQVPLNSGTWYYEIYVDSAGSSSGQFSIGWSESNRSVSDDNSGGDTEGWITYALNGNYYSNGGNGSYGATYTTGDVIGCKIDTNSSTNNIEFYKNGASQGTKSQAFNTGGTGFISPYILLYSTRNATVRFAQSEWTQTPSGITEANAINTKNVGS
jgi:hypothetical protein